MEGILRSEDLLGKREARHNLGFKDSLEAIHFSLDGEIKTSSYDLITTSGKSKAVSILGGVEAVPAFGWIAIGTDGTAPGAAQTTLLAETSRTASSNSITTTGTAGDTLQAVATFNFVGASTILESGLFNNATPLSTEMLCRTTLSVAVSSGDSLQLTYKIQAT